MYYAFNHLLRVPRTVDVVAFVCGTWRIYMVPRLALPPAPTVYIPAPPMGRHRRRTLDWWRPYRVRT